MTFHPLQQYRPWRFLVLLITLLLLLAIPPMVQGFAARSPLSIVLYSLVMVAAILSLFEGRWLRWAVLGLGGSVLLGRWLAFLLVASSEDAITLADHFGEVIFLGFVAAMILRAIFTQTSISIDSIFGAICVYLLVGLAWGSLYSITEVFSPGSFQASGKLAETLKSPEIRQPVLTYYSFVTMTTVGYGDITPVSPPARTLAWLEAMTGQFYIAVLVAFLIGIRVSQGPMKKDNGSSS
jgi:voltage-gated potassium channel